MKLEWENTGNGYLDLRDMEASGRLVGYIYLHGKGYHIGGRNTFATEWPEGITSLTELQRYIETVVRMELA